MIKYLFHLNNDCDIIEQMVMNHNLFALATFVAHDLGWALIEISFATDLVLKSKPKSVRGLDNLFNIYTKFLASL